MPRISFTLPKHPLIPCEAQATRLNGWSGEVGGGSQPKSFVYMSPNMPPKSSTIASNRRAE